MKITLGLVCFAFWLFSTPTRSAFLQTPLDQDTYHFLGHLDIPGLRSGDHLSQGAIGPFFHDIRVHQDICPSADGQARSHTGYIGLKDDTPEEPRRSFFWYYEAQEDPANAPLILTFGGGPGTSGMINPMFGQGHCLIADANRTVPNPDAWSRKYNVLALDHPIGAGFSEGSLVNNSRAAALDTFDFLQRFYALYPHLAENRFFISGGSYGGIYVPHIATVINEKNAAFDAEYSTGRRLGASQYRRVPLEGLIVSNPISDPISYYRWVLQTLCYDNDAYNSTTCDEMYQILPTCLEGLDHALLDPTAKLQDRRDAMSKCDTLTVGDMHGTVREDTRRKCYPPPDDKIGLSCFPEFGWALDFFNNDSIKSAIGAQEDIEWNAVSMPVWTAFSENTDLMQRAHLLYVPLLESGIRVLHYVGKQDANCGWRGVLSFLNLIPSFFQKAFVSAPDSPWTTHGAPNANATVRSVGPAPAGNMTLVLIDGAGHFVVHDQPTLSREIVERWIENVPYIED